MSDNKIINLLIINYYNKVINMLYVATCYAKTCYLLFLLLFVISNEKNLCKLCTLHLCPLLTAF